MTTETDEFSFMLKPAEYGIGVFAVHTIANGTKLRLFGEEGVAGDRKRMKSEVPEAHWVHCLIMDDHLMTPRDYGRMEVGWYMNHSSSPNAVHQGEHFYAARDIQAGEEILIDYNTLGEPEEVKEDFYKS